MNIRNRTELIYVPPSSIKMSIEGEVVSYISNREKPEYKRQANGRVEAYMKKREGQSGKVLEQTELEKLCGGQFICAYDYRYKSDEKVDLRVERLNKWTAGN